MPGVVALPWRAAPRRPGRLAAASCISCWLTISMPMVPLSRKFEIVAPVKVVFWNSLKSMNGLPCGARTKKKTQCMPRWPRRQAEDGGAGPAHLRAEDQHDHQGEDADDEEQQADDVEDFFGPVCSALLSGVPQIMRNEMTETTIEAKKMTRQPTGVNLIMRRRTGRPGPSHPTSRWTTWRPRAAVRRRPSRSSPRPSTRA